MKNNKIIAICLLLICITLLSGCSSKTKSCTDSNKQQSQFVTIERVTMTYEIVYHKDTKVMYAVSYGDYNRGEFTLLVNPDGTPMLYEEKTN